MCLWAWYSPWREKPFGQPKKVVEPTATCSLALPAWLWSSIGCERCQDDVPLQGYKEWSGRGRKKDLPLPQSLVLKSLYCVGLRCRLESSASAVSRKVCGAIHFLRSCILVWLAGLPCWQSLTDRPSEGGMWWTLPTWFPFLLHNPWNGLTQRECLDQKQYIRDNR